MEGLPIIYGYTDYRKFLEDWLEARQRLDRKFNRSEMHRRLGLPNTRSYLSDVLAGKDVSPTFLERFVVVLELTSDEARFFRVLVRFNQSTSPEERELAFDQLVALNRTPRAVLDPRHYRYYRNWWNGAVRALLSIHDIGDEYRKLSNLVQPAITESQARESMALLAELELVAKNDQGFWKPTTHTLSTGEGARGELVRQLQVQQLGLVQNAALRSGPTGQVVATNTISVSEKGLEMIRKRLERFRSEIRSIVHKDENPATRVHLVSLAIVPISREVPEASGAAEKSSLSKIVKPKVAA
ncbi:MAG: TIGR02147 family protein [Fibrobacterota bacterium]